MFPENRLSPPAPLRIGDQDDLAAACGNLLHVRDRLLEHAIVRRNHDHRHGLVDERDRPMLELAGGIAFGMDVRNFLELERTFQRDRKARAPTEIENVARLSEILRELSICGSSVSAAAIKRGTSIRARTRFCSSASDMWPRARPAAMARQASALSWQVNAFVDATPISGPASVGITTSLSRAMVESAR